jgi:hypothetical protein
LRASDKLIRKPQTIGVKVKSARPINIGAMNAQKAIGPSHFRCFQNGTGRGLVVRICSALTDSTSFVVGRTRGGTKVIVEVDKRGHGWREIV